MIVNKDRSVLVSFVMVTLCLATTVAATGYGQTQPYPSPNPSSQPYHAYRSPHWGPSSHTTASGETVARQPYVAPAIRRPAAFVARPFNSRPVISMALPTAGPYQGGLRFASRQGYVVQPTAFTTTTLAPSTSTASTPFLTVSEQINKTGGNVLQSPPSYIGGAAHVSGQSVARMAVRRAVNGNVGLGGAMLQMSQF